MVRASYFREHESSVSVRERLITFLKNRLNLKEQEYEIIVSYLKERKKFFSGKNSFGIVYDLTNFCNLRCNHCAVDAVSIDSDSKKIEYETSTEEAMMILNKAHEYTKARKFPRVSLVFGGGEPTLREDFQDIVRYASRIFGQESVGFCTNGTRLSVDDLRDIQKTCSFIEVSIDGPEVYHNAWRNPRTLSAVDNPFQKSVTFVLTAAREDDFRKKLEVSSIVTKDNLALMADYIKFLRSIGIENFSIHRAMPVGRMSLHLDKVPSMYDYLQLILIVAQARSDSRMQIHIHHSLESIYSALFLGEDIYRAIDLPMGSGRHSIGIDPKGNVHFDPWCFVPPFNKLAAGNLLDISTNLWDIMEPEDGIIKLVDEMTKKKTRCKQCVVDCVGGMRLNAMAYYICRLLGKSWREANESHLLAGMSQIDPACPLFED